MLKKVSEFLPVTSTGLFSAFNNPVWCVSFPNAEELDTYFYLMYGDRLGCKMLQFYADSTDGTVKGEKLLQLANMIYTVKGKSWEHLYGVFKAEYNPIENTDFIETITESTGNTKVIDTDTTNGGTASTTSSATNSGTNSGANNVYGFNSVTAVGDSTSSGSNSDTTSATTSTTTTGTGTEDTTVTDNGTHTSEHRKHGNIGVLETQSMLQSEVDFWKWSFIDQVCKDICDLIALSIY